MTPRRISKLNALLLVGNVLLLSILAVCWVLPAGERVKQSLELQQELGMRPFVTKRPFSILVDPSFPDLESFCFKMDKRPLMLHTKDLGNSRREVRAYFGVDHGIELLVDMGKGGEICEIILSNRGTHSMDLNGDGSWDLRINASPRRMEVRLDEGWGEVLLGGGLGKYSKQLQTGEAVTFNMDSGNWELDESTGQPTLDNGARRGQTESAD